MPRVVSGPHSPNPSICPICRKQFAEERIKNAHIKLIHKNAGNFGCDFCKKTFSCNLHLSTHRRSHTGEKPFGCKICKKAYTSQYNLKIHHLNHHAEKFKCGQAIERKSKLKQHLVFHSEKKPFPSEEDSKRFASGSHSKSDGLHNDSEETRKFICDKCDLDFRSELNLKRHLVVHRVAAKQFECLQCGDSFYLQDSLDRHLKCHWTDQRKMCEQRCPAKPADSQDLRDGKYRLRARRETPNYRVDQESGDLFDESDEISQSSSSECDASSSDFLDRDVLSESSEQSDPEDGESSSEFWDTDDESDGSEEEEDDLEDKAVRGGGGGVLHKEKRNCVASDQKVPWFDEPRPLSSIASANLKMVFDQKYRAPK